MPHIALKGSAHFLAHSLAFDEQWLNNVAETSVSYTN